MVLREERLVVSSKASRRMADLETRRVLAIASSAALSFAGILQVIVVTIER